MRRRYYSKLLIVICGVIGMCGMTSCSALVDLFNRPSYYHHCPPPHYHYPPPPPPHYYHHHHYRYFSNMVVNDSNIYDMAVVNVDVEPNYFTL